MIKLYCYTVYLASSTFLTGIAKWNGFPNVGAASQVESILFEVKSFDVDVILDENDELINTKTSIINNFIQLIC